MIYTNDLGTTKTSTAYLEHHPFNLMISNVFVLVVVHQPYIYIISSRLSFPHNCGGPQAYVFYGLAMPKITLGKDDRGDRFYTFKLCITILKHIYRMW